MRGKARRTARSEHEACSLPGLCSLFHRSHAPSGWFDERRLSAELYAGNRKRAPDAENDVERMEQLRRPPTPPPAPSAPSETEQVDAAEGEPRPKRSRWEEPSRAADGVGTPASSGAPAACGGGAPAGLGAPAELRLPTGGYVKIRGLVGASERNGQVGVLEGYDDASERYAVTLRDGSRLSVRRANLLQMVEVTLATADSAGGAIGASADVGAGAANSVGAADGARGTVFDFDEVAEMYGVELSSGEAVPAAVGAVVVPRGTVGVIRGLQAATAAHLNGSLARVLEHDALAGRYLVDAAGRQLRVRRHNLHLAG